MKSVGGGRSTLSGVASRILEACNSIPRGEEATGARACRATPRAILLTGTGPK